MERLVRPKAQVLEALRGKVSELLKTISRKPGEEGKEVSVRIVLEGAGMVGLSDWRDNKEWAGIFNHFVKTAGAAVKIGRLLELNGEDVDVQLLLDTVLLSHSGRRQFEEAKWYPEIVVDSADKAKKADSSIAMSFLREAGVDERIIEMVAVHTLGAENGYSFGDMDSWNKKLPMYLDFRIAQGPMPLEQRVADLQRAVEAGRVTQESLERWHQWAIQTEEELVQALRVDADRLKEDPNYFSRRIDVAVLVGKLSSSIKDVLKEERVRNGLLESPKFIELLEFNPEDICDSFLKPERWERYLRRLYLLTDGIIDEKLVAEMNNNFPENSWWGKYVRELYKDQEGKPYKPRHGKAIGIQRAIDFFGRIDKKREAEENVRD